MAIIIPSKNTYNIYNNKILDNKITAVSYPETSIENKEVVWWQGNMPTSGSTQNTITKNSDWVYVSPTQRKRHFLEITTHRRNSTLTNGTSAGQINIPTSPDWSKVYFKATQSTNNGAFDIISSYKKTSSLPDVPIYNPNDNSDAIFYCNGLWNVLFEFYIGLDSATKTVLFVTYALTIYLDLETENLIDNEWVAEEKTNIYKGLHSTFWSGAICSKSDVIKTNVNVRGEGNISYGLRVNDLINADTKFNGNPIGEYIANSIIYNYGNGKETAEVICAIADYYDENGNKVKSIDSENMFFDLYDIVVPMKYDNVVGDLPISQNADLNAKTFIVLGVEIYYDGAILQRLTLRETGESIEIPFDKI